jgi:hypothetical protein
MYANQGPFGTLQGPGVAPFADPFHDMASLSTPSSWRSLMLWCEKVYSRFGTYRTAMERIISYFLTEVSILNASEDETVKWNDFFGKTLDGLSVVQNMLRNRQCFHGDTRAVTRHGVFRLRDLAGKTVDVLSQGGVYRPADFRSFGKQELLEVEFGDGRKVMATPDHQWVARNCSGKPVRVPTTTLCAGYSIERTVAPRPEKDDDYYEGVRHGFTFGDGSTYNKGKQASAYFHGAKDSAMLRYFRHAGCAPRVRPERKIVNGLPAHYKRLPANDNTASYWYGFVCGFLAADGSVDTHGCALLTQKSADTLRVVAEQLPRIGMAAGPLRGHERTAQFVRHGETFTYAGKMHYLTLLKRFMLPEDFLLPAHRAKFEKNYQPTEYGRHVMVKSVRRTGVVDEVFCCVEKETHTFVIENGVLTGNCYGNSFASMVVPFKRFLVCPRRGCGYMTSLDEAYNNKTFNFHWKIPEFHATCPVCKVGSGYSGKWIIDDKDDDEERTLRVKIWSPHEIETVHDTLTEDMEYIWRIPEDYKLQIRRPSAALFHLARAPQELIKAIHLNQVYKFRTDAIFHMKEPTLAGIVNRGWGIPRTLANFSQIFYVQVLRRQNEAIAMDYVMPWRVISPGPGEGTTGGAGGIPIDPLSLYNGSDFRRIANKMIRDRRRDPASVQVMPFPVNFQMFGAEANQLAPRDLLDQAHEVLLNDAGTPVELYNGSLQLQTAPVALRLFESTWHHLVHDCNAFLRWLIRQISQILSWETVDAELKRVTIADNLEKQMMAAQLMMSQQLSGTTVLGDFGYNWRKEQRQIADEARFAAETQARTEEEMQTAGFAQQIAKGQAGGQQGAPPAGGAGAGGQAGAMGMPMPGPVTQYLSSVGPNVPQSPEDMLAVADSMAIELMGQPESTKNSELRKLKQVNEALHHMVRGKIDQKRRDTKNAAGNQAVGQMQQQMQQGGAPPA